MSKEIYYRVPYKVNEDGIPRIQAEEYEEYKEHLSEMADGLKKDRKSFI